LSRGQLALALRTTLSETDREVLKEFGRSLPTADEPEVDRPIAVRPGSPMERAGQGPVEEVRTR
ncbi:MAG TPA: hypothetical protein VHL09_04110, partial [Dehalococcoidia bacterium]|nr:hypothetical protein [Dehalococcoidia bacterium]